MNKSELRPVAKLVLADGTVFPGVGLGACEVATGEVVFNTAMSGYQEILTDPSYTNQMLTFTYPHIGNVGVNPEDVESDKVQVSGVIIREYSEQFSNYRAGKSLDSYLRSAGITGITGIDTRALVLHLREHGAQMGIIGCGNVSVSDLQEQARQLPSMEGLDLAKEVSTTESYEWREGEWQPGVGYSLVDERDLQQRPHVVALDFGVKYNILRLLTAVGFRVTVVPGNTNSKQILDLSPDAVFLSNGPGDPAAVTYGIQTTKELLGKQPLFGICLGHQILGLALDAPTFKLKFGHRGGNHPVKNNENGKVEITVQNHGFATDASRVPANLFVSHTNLNDGTVEGFEVPDARAFSVQYHPECSPGPHDAKYLFKKFYDLIHAH